MKDIYVFVYGSLKRGNYNHSHLIKAQFIAPHTTAAEYTLFDMGMYPAVIPFGDTAIQGEIYKVNEFELASLDALEGYPDYYDRILISSDYDDVWMYVLSDTDANFPIIRSGEWNIN